MTEFPSHSKDEPQVVTGLCFLEWVLELFLMKGSELNCHFPFCLVHEKSWNLAHVIEQTFDFRAQDVLTYFCSVINADRHSQLHPACLAFTCGSTKPVTPCSKRGALNKSVQRRLCVALILSEFSHSSSQENVLFVLLNKK